MDVLVVSVLLAVPGYLWVRAVQTNWWSANCQSTRVHRHQKEHDRECRKKVERAEARGNPREYYVYEHIDPHGSVRYIGHGRGDRAWCQSRASEAHQEMLSAGSLKIRVQRKRLTARQAVKLEADRLDRAFSQPKHHLFNKLRGTRI